MVDIGKLHRNLYNYTPSLAGTSVFIVLFALATCIHAFIIWRTRCKFFISLLVGAFFEFLGYVVRAVARQNTSSLGTYAIQNLLLLVAPALFAATIYMTLSRVIRQVGAAHLSIIKPAKLTRLFVWGDVICFWIQGAAAPLQAIQDIPILPVIGKWVVVAGLLLQVALFGFFVVVAGKFHRALLNTPTPASTAPGNQWQRIMAVLYGSSLLIFIRNCIRVAEYAEGFTGWIIRHEVMLFVFDALPMALLLAALIIWHPARMLTASHALPEPSGEEGVRLDDKSVPNVDSDC